jgi:cyclohexa-1,5-dienecarbonyl-CoA hydratase
MTDSVASSIHVRTEGRTAWLTLDRPPLNVMNIPMLDAMGKAVRELLAHTDVLVFESANARAFSVGVEVKDHDAGKVGDMLDVFHDIFRQLARGNAITVAAVQGHCLGGGMELATFCDFVIATESATFGQPEIKLGCFPPVALVTLPAIAGFRAAMDLILTGRAITAREARELGLVSRLVPDGSLATAVSQLISELRGLSPAVLRMTRRALWRHSGMDFEKALAEAENLYLNELMKTEDAQEGIRAFLEKRQPVWRNT